MQRAGYLSQTSEQVLQKLRALDYVNDESFARNWALLRAQNRGYGPRRVEQELRAKGVLPSVIREAVREAFDQCDEKAQARRILAKRLAPGSLRDPKTLRRAAAFLERRGYSSRVISELLQIPAEEE